MNSDEWGRPLALKTGLCRKTPLLDTDEPRAALNMFAAALTSAHAVQSQKEQAHALDGAGRCQVALGDSSTAKAQLRQAIELYRRLGAPEAEAVAAYLSRIESSPAS